MCKVVVFGCYNVIGNLKCNDVEFGCGDVLSVL